MTDATRTPQGTYRRGPWLIETSTTSFDAYARSLIEVHATHQAERFLMRGFLPRSTCVEDLLRFAVGHAERMMSRWIKDGRPESDPYKYDRGDDE